MSNHELLTTEQVAQRLQVDVQTIRKWIRQGVLPAVHLARRIYRVRPEVLDAFERERETTPRDK